MVYRKDGRGNTDQISLVDSAQNHYIFANMCLLARTYYKPHALLTPGRRGVYGLRPQGNLPWTQMVRRGKL